MIARIRGPDNRVEEYTEKKLWVAIFDPATPIELKGKMKEALREGAREDMKTWLKEVEFDGASKRTQDLLRAAKLPKGMTVAAVMTSGFCCTDFYASLHEDSKADRFVLIGYSSGMHDPSKHFSDGTPMTGKVYITQEDLRVIKNSLDAPLLIADTCVETGLTMAVLGNTLKKSLGYSGKMYQAEVYGVPNKWTGKFNSETGRYDYLKGTPLVVPIVTDAQDAAAPKNQTVLPINA